MTLQRCMGALATLLVGALPVAGGAQVPVDVPGQVVTMPPVSAHWATAGDAVLRRTAFFDLDTGALLGQLGSGFGPPDVRIAQGRGEAYAIATYYSRGDRGERTDVLSIYDLSTLAFSAEVVLPPRRAVTSFGGNLSGLSDDERFAFVFNLTPATSVTVVDLETRSVASEIETAGCSLIYPAGPRRFAMLCMNGALLLVELDEAGRESGRTRSEPFFDPEVDPAMEKGVRVGNRWLFPSFEGLLHEVDLSGPSPSFASWSLVDDDDRAERWRVGGANPLAAHAGLGRLYVAMHQGDADTHKQAGTELWVFDLETHERIHRRGFEAPGLTYLSFAIEPPPDMSAPLAALSRWLLGMAKLPIGELAVTQDDSPLLVTGAAFSGGLGVYDARSLEFLRRVYPANAFNIGVHTPFQAGTGKAIGP